MSIWGRLRLHDILAPLLDTSERHFLREDAWNQDPREGVFVYNLSMLETNAKIGNPTGSTTSIDGCSH